MAPDQLALIYAVLAAFPIFAQIALALGAPWGSITLGGRYPGQLPTKLRPAAVLQATILTILAAIVLDQANAISIGLPDWTIWVTVAVMTASAILNTITPSRIERLLWSPVTILKSLIAWTLALT